MSQPIAEEYTDLMEEGSPQELARHICEKFSVQEQA